MAVEQKLEIDGEVTEALPNLLFRVKLENDHELLAHLAGKMRRFRIRVLPGDKVRVEVSPVRPQPRPHRLPLQVGPPTPRGIVRLLRVHVRDVATDGAGGRAGSPRP